MLLTHGRGMALPQPDGPQATGFLEPDLGVLMMGASGFVGP